jgi:hypothetical protein
MLLRCKIRHSRILFHDEFPSGTDKNINPYIRRAKGIFPKTEKSKTDIGVPLQPILKIDPVGVTFSQNQGKRNQKRDL